MNERIRDKLKTLTTKPGVYVMRDKDGVIIYVGKAKNLKPHGKPKLGNDQSPEC